MMLQKKQPKFTFIFSLVLKAPPTYYTKYIQTSDTKSISLISFEPNHTIRLMFDDAFQQLNDIT